MQEKPKFCKDCKYFAFTRHCKHPNNGFNLVTGELFYGGADYNRKVDSLCGEAAKWFEVKPPKPVPPPTTETMYKSGGVYSVEESSGVCFGNKETTVQGNPKLFEQKVAWYKFWK